MKQIEISDHALIRYLERVHGIDLTPIKKEIADAIQPAVNVGASSVRIGGFTYCLTVNRQGSAVLTTVHEGKKTTMTAKQRTYDLKKERRA